MLESWQQVIKRLIAGYYPQCAHFEHYTGQQPPSCTCPACQQLYQWLHVRYY